jgi:Protein of unknown function (DUF3891)
LRVIASRQLAPAQFAPQPRSVRARLSAGKRMVLRPDGAGEHRPDGFVPAWEAVARTQRAKSRSYQLVPQPDHAWLSGQIVEQFAISSGPAVDHEIACGVRLHDEGWAAFDKRGERLIATPARYGEKNIALNENGKPLSFLEIKAGDFLRAWHSSIESAEAIAPIAGLMVSGHFSRIGRFGVGTGTYSPGDTKWVHEFLTGEEQRRSRLLRLQQRSEREVEYWTDVLQFCDLLSLYLCCGSEQSIEFPQRVGPNGATIRLQVQDGVNVLSPSVLAREVEFSLAACPYPVKDGGVSKLSWRVR